jgi:hypothetical protein
MCIYSSENVPFLLLKKTNKVFVTKIWISKVSY